MSLRIATLDRQIHTPLPPAPIHLLRHEGKLDVEDFHRVAFGPYFHLRAKLFQVISKNKSIFRHSHIEDMDREQQREMTYRQLRVYMENMPITFEEFEKDPIKGTVVSNTLYVINPSLSIAIGVHVWLYMKTIMIMGTDAHREFKLRASDLRDFGCFALTEIDHGSNVKGIRTEAHYCHDTKSFIIHSPCKEAMKFWIGGAANVSTMSVVWAQLYINGKCYGVHTYVVPLRDNDTRNLLPGITVGDCGPKNGLNGVDNGFILFDRVRIPKRNQLDRISGVDEDGNFVSTFKSENKRFGMQLGALSGGRTILALNSIALAINAMAIAIRYTLERKQFSAPKSTQQVLIADYPLTKYRMMTLLSQTVVYHFGGLQFTELWDANFYNVMDPKNTIMPQLHAISSVLKAKSSWFTNSCIGECRQMLGGHGYSMYSKLGSMFNDNDINTTYEGDNNILLQQTAKYIFDGARQSREGKEVSQLLGFLKKSFTLEEVTEERLKSVEFLEKIVCSQIKELLAEADDLFAKEAEKGTSLFDIWSMCQIHIFKQISLLFGDLYYLQASKATEDKFLSPQNKQIYHDCVLLWFWKSLQTSHFGDEDSRRLIKNLIYEYCERVHKQAVRILDALAVPSDIIGSPFADENGQGMSKYYNVLYSGKDTFKRVDWYRLMIENAHRHK